MARGYFGTNKLWGIKVALLFLALVAVMGTAGSGFAFDGRDGNAYVNYHRDRLLDTYAQHKGLGNRVNAWNTLNYRQRMLFLIQTDLLGNRTFMSPVSTDYYLNNPDNNGFKNVTCGNGSAYCGTCTPMGGVQYCSTCEVYTEITDWGMGCKEMTAWDCYQAGLCYQGQSKPRQNFEMALEHVTYLYEILGYGDFNADCGGGDNNRIFWQADDRLIQAFRNRTMPEWSENGDAGANIAGFFGANLHAPFDNASSTLNGQPSSCLGPDGQVQFYSWDRVCTYIELIQGQKGCSYVTPFYRGSAYLPADSRMFELDDDYNTTHDSSPACYYCGGQYAVNMYQNVWCASPVHGNAASCDWNYSPTPATYLLSVSKAGTGTGTVSSYPGGINCGTSCSPNYTSGSQVTLTATADSGSTFAGWSGACSGTSNCMVAMDSSKSVTAMFNKMTTATSATFVRVDTTTQGNWKVAYGPDGVWIDQDVKSLPGYAQVAVANDWEWIWVNPTTDVRALQRGSGSSGIASCWYGSSFSLDINLTDGQTHQVAFYLVDWDWNGWRQEHIDIRDAATGQLLDSRVVSYFQNGQYWVWNLKGHVTVTITNTGYPNAVVSGIFFGGTAAGSNAYYCCIPSQGCQHQFCDPAYHPTACYTASGQSTTCP